MIVKKNNIYYLYSHKNKILGKFNTLKQAEKREKQINYFKWMKK